MDDKEFELKKLEFEKSLQLRQFEIDNFWKRAWFFGALLGALVTGYFQLKSSELFASYAQYVAFLSFLVSLGQSLMNRGSKYWQERWEYVTKNRESELKLNITKARKFNKNERYYIDACIRAKGENWFVRSKRFSVSKIAILIWDLITIFCLLVWLSDLLKLKTYGWLFYLSFGLYLVPVLLIKSSIVECLLKSKNGIKEQKHNNYYQDSEDYVENNKSALNTPR